MIRIAAAVLVAVMAGATARAETVLLPDVSVHLLAAHYAPVDTDFRWVGWIGAGAGLVAVGGVTAYFTADVETIIGNTRRTFDANQANYHLEAGLRRRLGERHEAAIVFHHVSRHLVDRVKVEAVDWNVLGVRVAGRRAGRVPLAYAAGLGHTTLASLVGYRWEATGHLDAALVPGERAEAYVAGDARFVTVERSDAFPRGNFLDRAAEGGVRWRRGGRRLEVFAAGQRRHDVFVQHPGAWSRALFGFRIAYTGR
ncbi:MAG TPA: hypothetical protein VGN09_05290 [Vicinamibacteria bacterium]|jgi:hypothetical protein